MPFRADPWLHVIAGCMSSGKTDELLRLLRRAEIARRRILLVRPAIDSRTPGEYAESRSKARFPSVLVNPAEPSSVLALARERDADMVGIEEAQFFDDQLVDVVVALRDSGRHVIASGLSLDFAGRPFGSMPQLLALADSVTMLTAICVVCGDTATRTQRLVGGRPAAIDDPLVVIGGFDTAATETYEARCHRHHEIGAPRATSQREASLAGPGGSVVASPPVSRQATG
ncbi:MAG: thymidine kinase [Chloroflexi bacterium]|nr:thymidine kinase [Chloroflexota bacterium]